MYINFSFIFIFGQSWSKILGALSRNSITFTSFLITIEILAILCKISCPNTPYPPYQCRVTPWTDNTLQTTLNGGRGGGVAILVIEVGVKFRTVSVKSANIFDQDLSECALSCIFIFISSKYIGLNP